MERPVKSAIFSRGSSSIVAVEGAVATVDHADIRGSEPHNRERPLTLDAGSARRLPHRLREDFWGRVLVWTLEPTAVPVSNAPNYQPADAGPFETVLADFSNVST
jgi:hypothetical protein